MQCARTYNCIKPRSFNANLKSDVLVFVFAAFLATISPVLIVCNCVQIYEQWEHLKYIFNDTVEKHVPTIAEKRTSGVFGTRWD